MSRKPFLPRYNKTYTIRLNEGLLHDLNVCAYLDSQSLNTTIVAALREFADKHKEEHPVHRQAVASRN